MSKYKDLPADEPWEFHSGCAHKLQCCVCGLVHDIRAEIVDPDTANLYLDRNNRATGQVRRHMKKEDR